MKPTKHSYEKAVEAFRAAGLDSYTIRVVKGVWVATYLAPSVAMFKRGGRGAAINCFAALRADGTTTLGVHDLLCYHVADAIRSHEPLK